MSYLGKPISKDPVASANQCQNPSEYEAAKYPLRANWSKLLHNLTTPDRDGTVTYALDDSVLRGRVSQKDEWVEEDVKSLEHILKKPNTPDEIIAAKAGADAKKAKLNLIASKKELSWKVQRMLAESNDPDIHQALIEHVKPLEYEAIDLLINRYGDDSDHSKSMTRLLIQHAGPALSKSQQDQIFKKNAAFFSDLVTYTAGCLSPDFYQTVLRDLNSEEAQISFIDSFFQNRSTLNWSENAAPEMLEQLSKKGLSANVLIKLINASSNSGAYRLPIDVETSLAKHESQAVKQALIQSRLDLKFATLATLAQTGDQETKLTIIKSGKGIPKECTQMLFDACEGRPDLYLHFIESGETKLSLEMAKKILKVRPDFLTAMIKSKDKIMLELLDDASDASQEHNRLKERITIIAEYMAENSDYKGLSTLVPFFKKMPELQEIVIDGAGEEVPEIVAKRGLLLSLAKPKRFEALTPAAQFKLIAKAEKKYAGRHSEGIGFFQNHSLWTEFDDTAHHSPALRELIKTMRARAHQEKKEQDAINAKKEQEAKYAADLSRENAAFEQERFLLLSTRVDDETGNKGKILNTEDQLKLAARLMEVPNSETLILKLITNLKENLTEGAQMILVKSTDRSIQLALIEHVGKSLGQDAKDFLRANAGIFVKVKMEQAGI